MQTNNVTWHQTSVSRNSRQQRNGHRGCVIWLTGLSGSGKSTVANQLSLALFQRGVQTYVLDGDNLRCGINSNLGFSDEDRDENVRRVAEVAKLFVDAGMVVIAAVISPMKHQRDMARKKFGANEFVEVFVDCPLDVCQTRDPKGLYKKARQGKIVGFTGIDAPYQPPAHPQVTVQTHVQSIEQGVDRILHYLNAHRTLRLSDGL
ncbi:adenylyl-sulfate kinase [Alicyclobacillus dauci]|uniref:Adenylyl-sulfate kinase n=1 Tax=Alicyclobacillus dauci TaxID=1475485 RepID=A0ABY6Z2M9_9BACL|nr:adenylyl-sulfate kinase [Alicyclobacillus dauci]WAH36937.1 adenylyl-sulfate kinase [Alicyclobacillus dauci]